MRGTRRSKCLLFLHVCPSETLNISDSSSPVKPFSPDRNVLPEAKMFPTLEGSRLLDPRICQSNFRLVRVPNLLLTRKSFFLISSLSAFPIYRFVSSTCHARRGWGVGRGGGGRCVCLPPFLYVWLVFPCVLVNYFKRFLV